MPFFPRQAATTPSAPCLPPAFNSDPKGWSWARPPLIELSRRYFGQACRNNDAGSALAVRFGVTDRMVDYFQQTKGLIYHAPSDLAAGPRAGSVHRLADDQHTHEKRILEARLSSRRCRHRSVKPARSVRALVIEGNMLQSHGSVLQTARRFPDERGIPS